MKEARGEVLRDKPLKHTENTENEEPEGGKRIGGSRGGSAGGSRRR